VDLSSESVIRADR